MVIIVVAVVVAIAGSWLMVIQPKRDQAAKLGAQVKAAQAQLDGVRAQIAAGEAAKNSFASNYTELASLGEAVPADDNVPSLIYQLQGAASAAQVDFRGLLLTPSGATSTPPATGAANQASTATLPPGAAVGPAGFPIEPFSFTFRGNFFHLADFFNRLEQFVVANNDHVSVSGRLMTLNSISLGPAPKGFPEIQASISATTYLVPASQGLMGGASPAGPASSGSQAASTPSSGVPAPTAAVAAPVK